MRTLTLRRLAAALLAILALFALPVFAQDASQVLRLSVGFRTLKNSTQLSDERRQEVEQLEAQARAATQAGKFGDALRHYHHAMTLIRNQAWTPARALGLALQLKADRVVYDPGNTVRLTITQAFTLEQPLAGQLTGALAIARAGGGNTETPKELKSLAAVKPDFTAQPFTLEASLPDLADGNYQLRLTLNPAEGEPILRPLTIRIARGLTAEAAALKTRASSVAAELKQRHQEDLLRALAAVEYAVSMLDLANAGQLGIERLDLKGELINAASLLDQLAKGESPLRSKRGDFRWAYRSMIDNELQPYRVYVPTNYDPAKTYPLVVALHGMGGDENSYFTAYDNGIIKRQAEARGYLVVCPKGRAPASMYLGSAERDVMDVIGEMKRDYKIDPDRIYLTGHSMGGYGTWSVAANHPDIFAALAPIAGGGQPASLSKIAHIPQIVIHGDKDPTVPVEESRKMVKAAQELGIKVKYIEVPGGNHSNIVVPNMKEIFDWFDAHKRQPKAAKAASGQTR
jgi:predicted esterase